MKILRIAINIISGIPLAIYPGVLIASIMLFDAPDSDTHLWVWAMFFLAIGYPILIVLPIIFSQRYKSVWIALLGLIPLLFFSYVFFIQDDLRSMHSYNSLSKDFVCDSNSFVHMTGAADDSIRSLSLFERKYLFVYSEGIVDAHVYGNKWVYIEPRYVELFSCKNNEGKPLSEVYSRIEEEQIRDILKQI